MILNEEVKKEHHDIVVDDLLYTWSYQPSNNSQENDGELKIWKNKKVIYKSVVDCNISITPFYIAELIAAIEDFGDISNK